MPRLSPRHALLSATPGSRGSRVLRLQKSPNVTSGIKNDVTPYGIRTYGNAVFLLWVQVDTSNYKWLLKLRLVSKTPFLFVTSLSLKATLILFGLIDKSKGFHVKGLRGIVLINMPHFSKKTLASVPRRYKI